MSYSKYHSSKSRCRQGHVHDSKREACRCDELHLLQRIGEISELEVQKKYVLIPAQREQSSELYKQGAKKGQPKPGRVIEKECSYLADFDYIDRDGSHVVEDVLHALRRGKIHALPGYQ